MNPFLDGFAAGLKPDPRLSVSEWADTYRMLPSKGAAEPGRYRTSRAPFLRDIMNDLSPHSPVERVVFMKSSQVGGTELGLNWLGAIIHLYPAPVMMVQPTIELAERFSKQRIQPMIDETPELSERIPPARTRDSGNSILLKNFMGGVLVVAGSNSGASLRQMPVKFLFCDEISAYTKDASDEGDPVSLAEKRTQTFSRRKIFLNSTPTSKGTCRIEAEYELTDQRKFYVPCPLCGAMQYLKFAQLKWDEGNPSSAKYECEHCHERFEEYHKTKMLAAGEWQATAQCEDPRVRGYHINALYSPLGWKSWAEIAKEFLKSKSDAMLLKAFVNSILGETFEEEYAAKVGAEGLRARVEFYEPGIVPAGGLTLVAGVDIQDNRFAVSVYAYGREEEAWVVLHEEIFGDPGRPEVWKQLDSVLLREYTHERGGTLRVSVAAIDTGGHFTHEVYQYVRERRSNPHTRILAVKGQSQKGKPALGKPTPQDVNFRGQKLKHGVDLYPVGSDTVKSVIYGRLKHNEPGPGYIHFHGGLNEQFFEQLTSEKQTIRYVKGFPVREWVKKNGARNEALDCAVYAYAAMQYLYLRYHRATIWNQLETKLTGQPAKTVTPSHEKTQEVVEPKLQIERPTRNINPIRRNGGFVSRW